LLKILEQSSLSRRTKSQISS